MRELIDKRRGITEKRCPQCREVRRSTQFPWKVKAKGLRHAHCRECQRKRSRSWYQRLTPSAKQDYLRRLRAKRAKKRADVRNKVGAILRRAKCADCGENDPLVLEFDHVQGNKRLAIARLMANEASWNMIKEEIAKCEVRCANCHRRRTAIEGGYWKTQI